MKTKQGRGHDVPTQRPWDTRVMQCSLHTAWVRPASHLSCGGACALLQTLWGSVCTPITALPLPALSRKQLPGAQSSTPAYFTTHGVKILKKANTFWKIPRRKTLTLHVLCTMRNAQEHSTVWQSAAASRRSEPIRALQPCCGNAALLPASLDTT